MTHRTPLALALAALALAGAPLAAQSIDPPKTPDTVAKEAAVDAQEAPVTQTLNNAVAAVGNDAEKKNADNQAQYADAKAQYEADRAAYRAAVEAHGQAVMRDDIRYDRQQHAYADAMAAWRLQVAECQAGHRKACDAPTPDPASFY